MKKRLFKSIMLMIIATVAMTLSFSSCSSDNDVEEGNYYKIGDETYELVLGDCRYRAGTLIETYSYLHFYGSGISRTEDGESFTGDGFMTYLPTMFSFS